MFESLGTDGTGILDIAAFQFHNDTHLRKSEVHVAGADAHLLYRVQTKRRQRIQKICFIDADRIAVNRRAAAYSSTHRRITRQVELLDNTVDIAIRAASNLCDLAAATILGVKIQLDNLFCAFARSGLSPRPSGCTLTFNPARGLFDGAPFALLGFPPTARRDAVCQQPLADNVTSDPVAFGQSVFTLPIEIVNDDGVYHVIRDMGTHFRETAALAIRKFHYSGHVYDFQTENGIIAANGIITHNCRCTLMSLSERQAKGMGYTGAPQDIPTWTDKHGVEHTAAPDKGWNHSPEHDLTDLLREREQRLNMNAAVYDSGDAPPSPEPWHPPLPTAGNAFEEARYDVVTRGQQDGLEHGRVVDANGQVIDTRQGKEQAISYQDIINLLPGTTLYHNHPSNMGLSMADIEFAGQAGLASVVAFGTTQEAAYSVSILSGWSEMYAAIYDAKKIVRQKVSRLFLSGKINEGEAAAMYAHIMALRLSDQGLITYKIAPASKEMADLINRYAAEIEQWRKETK